ncbi:PQQ-binding-like beta-propeller repeat protein, partial [Streptomyces sp. NPDC057456]|uniref:outer membrane protein assembly factor BamB family protein n=1 Tax=Streptomyces sp. NPDC057456 TaxID=3346139 RepID=UPI0036CA7AA1
MPWTQRSVRALRDRRLHAAATVLLLALTATTAAPPPRTPPASQDRHAARHPVTAAEHVPPVRWTASFPYGIDLDAVTSDTFFFQNQNKIWAVDISTGTTRWEQSPVYNGGPTAADDHAVYATADTIVQARDSSTGSFKWEQDLSNLLPKGANLDIFDVVGATLSRTSNVLY